MNRVINSSGIIIYFLKNYFLFKYNITKIDDRKIKHKPNTKMLKTVMKKRRRKVKLVRLFLLNYVF